MKNETKETIEALKKVDEFFKTENSFSKFAAKIELDRLEGLVKLWGESGQNSSIPAVIAHLIEKIISK